MAVKPQTVANLTSKFDSLVKNKEIKQNKPAMAHHNGPIILLLQFCFVADPDSQVAADMIRILKLLLI